MFTPEFTSISPVSYVLVANHYLETNEAIDRSTAFIRARILFGKEHVPETAAKFSVIYDIRGQNIATDIEAMLEARLGDIATVKIKRV